MASSLLIKLGSIVVIHRTKPFKRAKSFERRISKLLRNENGKRLHDGTFWFPYETSALKLVKLAEDFGMSTAKQIKFRKKQNVPQIMLFTEMKGILVPKEVKEKEIQDEKETKEFTKEFLSAGTEHQKQ